MKMPTAFIAVTFAYLVSFVLAADQPSAMMASDQATMMSGLRGSPSLFVPVGVVTNRIDAKGNNVAISKSNILISKSDRVSLAHTIENMMASNPKLTTMTNEDLFGLLSRIATNPSVFTNAAGIISAASRGDTGALAGHVVGLLGAVVPPTPTSTPVVAPTAAAEPPMVVPVVTPAAMIPVSPIAMPSPMSAPMAPAAASEPVPEPVAANSAAAAPGMST